jgi:hypothetical protein
MGIRYDLAFASEIDVGCNDGLAVSGNTSETAPVRHSVTAWDVARHDLFGYIDRPAFLQFEVTSPGNVTIDSYATAMMLFRGWGTSAVSDIRNAIEPDIMLPAAVAYTAQRVPDANWTGAWGRTDAMAGRVYPLVACEP